MTTINNAMMLTADLVVANTSIFHTNL